MQPRVHFKVSSLLKHWQSNRNQTCILHSYTIIGNWHAVTTCNKLELKVQHGNPHLLMRSKVYLCIFLANLFVLSCKI